ncbi:putative 2-dehydropantoate 2-reductase [Madurella mycetomatis]|uniref:2-dehydropantoate 2-reductase n=1 Tax=Madurella mycetomatis TaxID=100816 RepID=A0A175WHZ2_9PEZI|nr:putative 2-dehydropantoate 2-reductase [Madurella mycetomatis]
MPGDAIYVLGVGNLGKYVAHSLMKEAPGPVTLLFHRSSLEDQWRSAANGIQCITNGVPDTRSGFRIEVLPSSAQSPLKCSNKQYALDPIKYLIVTTKTYMTTGALELVKDRLSSETSILFLQNGMGTMDETSAKIFPDPKARPAYWAGICSAGVYSTDPFTIVHAGKGPLLVGLVEGPNTQNVPTHDQDAVLTQNTMVQRLSQAGVLETSVLSSEAIRESQLQKLVVNAIINPLTAIFRCQNGQLASNPPRLAVMKLLLEETGPIVKALLHTPSDMFSNQNLFDLVLSVAHKTRANTSSMLQDVQASRRTEIDYINGYIAAQGKRLAMPHVHNSTVVRLVKEGRTIQDHDIATLFAIRETY